MSDEIPRLRMFAGPNGSGKSTLKSVLRSELLGIYLNPDDMEREMKESGGLNLAEYGIDTTTDEIQTVFRASQYPVEAGLADATQKVFVAAGRVFFDRETVNSYLASVTAEFFRRKLIKARSSFTLETVMSHSGKIDLLAEAQTAGYRTYLYFIATEDPEINVSRVATRVQRGGHPVPEDKIIKRYHASLDLLLSAIQHTNRAYIFDNSSEGQDKTWLAEVTEGKELEMKTDLMPAWFRHAVWQKIAPGR